MPDTTLHLTTTSIEQTIAFGHYIGQHLEAADLILLSGGLGAGKTHLTKGIVAGLGSADTVTSPTYVFINEYRLSARRTVFHVDLYRAEDPHELTSIGLDDALSGHGTCIIEWPERDPSLFALPHLAIELTINTTGSRDIAMHALGSRASALIAIIRTTWLNGTTS